MALVDSLLSAMVRADGDALVMHVGERPYVVTHGGTLDLSTHGLHLAAMTGMLQQLLPAEVQNSLEELGAVEHNLPSVNGDRFTVVAARGGDDIWIEIRRRRTLPVASVEPAAQPAAQVSAPEHDEPARQEEATAQRNLADLSAEASAEAEAASGREDEPVTMPAMDAPVATQPGFDQKDSDQRQRDLADLSAGASAEEAVSGREGGPVEIPAADAPVAAEPSSARTDSEEGRQVLAAAAFGRDDGPVEPEVLDAAAPISVEEPPLAEPVTMGNRIAPLPAVATAEANVAREDSVARPPALAELSAEASAEAEAASARDDESEPMAAQAPTAVDRPPVSEPIAIVEPVEMVAAEETASSASVREDSVELPPDLAQAASRYEVAPEPAAAEVPIPLERSQMAEPIAIVSPTELTQAAETPDLASARGDSGDLARNLANATSARDTAPVDRNEPGVVVPIMRTVRIEVPPLGMPQSRTSTVERLLRLAAARGAASLFLTSEARPYIRVEGDIRVLEGEALLSRAEVEAAVMEIVPEEVQESIGSGEATEWIAELPELGRIRCTSFYDHRGPGVLFRMIATRPATAEQLGLTREVQALATEAQGLVLVAGSRGSGKSTLMSALVDLVNRQRAEYVITLERQIRLVHDNRAALVSQREIRGGADEALAAARAALRENPDVLVVDDLGSALMVPLLLEAAADGLLVFVSITAPSTADAVERLIEMAPAEMRASIQAGTAEAFRGAVAQVLLKKTGGGRVAAREILLATAAVTRLIGDGQLGQLPLALESGRRHGMVPLTDVLVGFVREGVVDVREAFRKTHDRDRLLSGLKREGVDTSVVERLA